MIPLVLTSCNHWTFLAGAWAQKIFNYDGIYLLDTRPLGGGASTFERHADLFEYHIFIHAHYLRIQFLIDINGHENYLHEITHTKIYELMTIIYINDLSWKALKNEKHLFLLRLIGIDISSILHKTLCILCSHVNAQRLHMSFHVSNIFFAFRNFGISNDYLKTAFSWPFLA